MYELMQISEKCYYINCPAKIGVYVPDKDHVYLIDSGNDKDAGKKVRQILDKNGWHLTAILNTHSNADHIGGNRYLQGQTGCKVYSGGIEAAFTKYPVLEPSFLYGGYPGKDLRHKFLMAQESDVTDFSDEGFPKEIEVIPLPGHFFDMVGFRMPDGVVFLADCLSSRETLEKYAVSFIYDVGAYLETLDMVEKMEAVMFVPAHAEATADIKELVRYNRDKVQNIADRILSICEQPVHFEGILQEVFKGYGLSMNFEQYVLVGSTVRSYLSWLKDTGKLAASFQDSMLLWQRHRANDPEFIMKTVLYEGIPNYAKEIRQKVFVDEQGFHNEFDDIDETATHIVMFDEDKIPIATCRIFWDTGMNTYILGRLAVIKEYRGKSLGSVIVKEAEKYIQKKGGKCLALHAQCRVTAFYQNLGFTEFGDIDDDEGCPHIWMKKSF